MELHSLLQAADRQGRPSLRSPRLLQGHSLKRHFSQSRSLPGRGLVTGEVTPKHSQFIACRQGTGAGLGAGRSHRAAEGSEEAAGDKDGTVLLSSSHLASEGCGVTLAFSGRRRTPAWRSWRGSGHPNPASPTDLLPWVLLWGQSQGQWRA